MAPTNSHLQTQTLSQEVIAGADDDLLQSEAQRKSDVDQAVVVNNDSIESEEDMSGSPETSDNESASESKNTLG